MTKMYQCERCKRVFVTLHNAIDLLVRCPDCEEVDVTTECRFICNIN